MIRFYATWFGGPDIRIVKVVRETESSFWTVRYGCRRKQTKDGCLFSSMDAAVFWLKGKAEEAVAEAWERKREAERDIFKGIDLAREIKGLARRPPRREGFF